MEAYFPFLAQVLLEQRAQQVDTGKLKQDFEKKYSIPISTFFINQVLGVGIEKGAIVEKAGTFIVDLPKLSCYTIPENDFDYKWTHLKNAFYNYCRDNGYETVDDAQLEAIMVDMINEHSIHPVIGTEWVDDEQYEPIDYCWATFLREEAAKKTDNFDFVTCLSASNAYKDALFLSSGEFEDTGEWRRLTVYLDSPMVFALLGMDSDERCNSCRQLIEEMNGQGCQVCVLDNNFEEIKGIITRAGTWATSMAYDIVKANNVAKYFHDLGKSNAEVLEYCEKLETELNSIGICVAKTDYDSATNKAQEDENLLCQMVEENYKSNNRALTLEKKESIACDIRSIIMVYRARHGKISTTLKESGHIMLTLNRALANVCKEYEKNSSISSGHIPACITADLFGAVLWLNKPIDIVEYQKKLILADCYAVLRPNKELMKKYIESLEAAYRSNEIDEKKYLFMRSHSVVFDALMNVTKGDYAKYTDRTYLDVYEEIVAISDRKYESEKNEHEDTKRQLAKSREAESKEREEKESLQQQFDTFAANVKQKFEAEYEKKVQRWAVVVWALMFGLPIAFVNVVIDIAKSKWITEMNFTNVAMGIGFFLILGVLGLVSAKGKKWSGRIVKSIFKYDYDITNGSNT